MGTSFATARISSAACSGDPCLPLNLDIGGVIHIGGDLWGARPGDGPAIFSDGGLSGKILIDGSLYSGDANEIEIEQAMTSAAAITIDYDGWDGFDDWEAGAIIRVDGVNHAESSASVNAKGTPPNLWHVTECRGDCNNDGVVDAFDIEPFLAILFDPVQYAADYPGLDGSMVYHGDMNCDKVVDAFDIEGFNARLFCGNPPCCSSDCAVLLGGGRYLATTILRPAVLRMALGMSAAAARADDDAQRLVDTFGDHTPRRYQGNLLNACAFLATHYREANDMRKSRMWLSVHDGLREIFGE